MLAVVYSTSMKYLFFCSQCGSKKEFEMSVAEYSKFKAVCRECGTEMTRVYEVPSVKGAGAQGGTVEGDHRCGGNSCGGIGGCSSCGDSCSSCSSCGI